MNRKYILVLSHLFPNDSERTKGIFIVNQLLELNKYKEYKYIILVPINLFKKYKLIQTKYSKLLNNCVIIFVPTVMIPHYKGVVYRTIMYFISLFVIYLLKIPVKPSIIHSHTIIPDGLIGVILGKLFKIRTICTAHGSDVYVRSKLNAMNVFLSKYVLKETDRIITVSNFIRNECVQLYDRKYDIIRNGFPEIKTIKHYYPYIDNRKTTRLLFVGTISRNKGIYELLDAYRILSRKYDRLELMYVGNGDELEELKIRVKKYDLSGVLITGEVEHEKVFEYYEYADIFILPSYNEGMPTVIFEAMQSGLAIIATKVGGIPEVIKSGYNGILVDNHVNDIVDSVQFLMNNPKIIIKLGKTAYKSVKPYSWRNIVKQLIILYGEVIENITYRK